MQMTMDMARKAVSVALEIDRPIMLWGPPGIGKSALVRSVAAQYGGFIDFRLSLRDPVDLRGLPKVNGEVSVWLPPSELPNVERDGETGILFLDEINVAPPSVQAAAFGLVLDRRLGEYELPPGWRIVAAGNRVTDRAAAQRMPSALANRFMHADLEASVKDFAAWASANGIRPEIVGFLRFREELLHDMNADRAANPTPRAWETVNRIIGQGLDREMEAAMIAATVGEPAMIELTGFLRIFRSLPDIDGVLRNPDSGEVPTDPAVLFAVSAAVSARIDRDNIGNAIRYLRRLPDEFAVFAMDDATRRNPAILKAPEVKGFIADYGDLLV